jgi:phage terminase large subunit-like protein
VVRTVERNVPYTAVRASRGKLVRAEPIAALYEQGKVRHIGAFNELEEQMASYTPMSKKSPDRLDALVWALTELNSRTGKAVWRIS